MEKPSALNSVGRFVKPVLIIVIIALLGAASTFLFWGDFTWRVYSDRLFWAGIGAIIIGGFAIWSALGSYTTLGTPNVLTAPGDARIAHARIKDHLATNAKRYGVVGRFIVAGLICMAASALIEVLTRGT